MTARVPPWAEQGVSTPASIARLAQSALLGVPSWTTQNPGTPQNTGAGGGHGVVGAGDLAVSQNGTPNMSVNVAAGAAFVVGTSNTEQGSYHCTNDAVSNQVIAASDPTNPRNDLVIAQVIDSNYAGASLTWQIAVVTGTPNASPVDPTVPASSLVLARVRVNATVTSILNANITDLRTRAASLGGTQVCTSTTRPTGSSLFAGLSIFETDTGKDWLYDGAAFQEMGKVTSANVWTPALTAATTNPTLGTGAVQEGRYFRAGKLVVAWFTIQFGSSGVVAGSGTYSVSTPVPILATSGTMRGMAYGFHAGTAAIAPFFVIRNGASTVGLNYGATYLGASTGVSNSGPWTWAASDVIDGFVIYETT